PSLDSAPAGEMPRWKIIDGNEGPITDITVIFRGDSVPEGFTKLERSPSGQRADLNNGGRGSVISLCQSKDLSSVKAPISEICYFSRARRGTQGEKIYLCFKRSTTSSIVDLVVMFPKKNETLPYGYMKVDKSPLGHAADLNANSEVLLVYKKKVASISDLHKKWLFASLRSSFALKAAEVREQELITAPHWPSAFASPDSPLSKPKQVGWKETIEYYMYPLLLACYTRHGNA
ncbi:hypothetical protein PI125_g26698, partial [Phytophthora idaei]